MNGMQRMNSDDRTTISGKELRGVVAFGRKCSKNAFPNPARTGCPDRARLRAMARRDPSLKVDDLPITHVVRCSPCFHEYMHYRHMLLFARGLRITGASLVAGILFFTGWLIVSIHAGRTFDIGRWNGETQSVLLDYRNESVTRSEAGEPVRPTRTLPRKKLDIVILLPVGSEPGSYELRLVGTDRQVLLDKSLMGEMENFALRVRANLDFRSLSQGSYLLEIRRVGEGWDSHPVVIR
jgi:hypothetical protein